MSGLGLLRPVLPAVRPHLGWPWLVLAACAAILLWLLVETRHQRLTHPLHSEMLRAARSMQAATAVIRREKQRQGLLQPEAIDPNRTGLIGPEFTPITTSLGQLEAKRTATNPDLAAAIVRALAPLDLRPGDPVVVTLSGSLIGANLAALAALDALGIEPLVVSSISASMFGATDPELTWLDMEAALAQAGILRTRSHIVLLGGVGGIARGLDPEGVAMLEVAAARNGMTPLVEAPLAALVEAILARIEAIEPRRPRLVVNAGGASPALGTCPESAAIPPGLSTRPLPCSAGVPGLVMRLAADGVPVLHLLNLRGLALAWGLPHDPQPLPLIGESARIYGGAPAPALQPQPDEAEPCCIPD